MSQPHILQDTPYSLPDTRALPELEGRIVDVRDRLRQAVSTAQDLGLIQEIRRAQDYWSVFESNRIEFEGPEDLKGTVDAIQSRAGQEVLRDLNANLLPRVLASDRRAFAAIGLEFARVIALRYISSDRRGIDQRDLRELHSVIMGDDWQAGGYRQFDAGIEGGVHSPLPTFMISPAMSELTDWSKLDVTPDQAILRAAIGHAWFTHIHPFQDGNGRVARLLANVLLGQDGLPPAIVKAQSQRSRYITALAHSDEAGDIMPVAGVFLEAVERYVRELSKPRTFRRMFRELVAGRGGNYFDWYERILLQFFDRLQIELQLYGLELRAMDRLTREVFEDTRDPDPDLWRTNRRENVTAGIVTNVYGREMSIYLHSPSGAARARLNKEEMVPSIAFAVPNSFYELDLHRRVQAEELGGLAGFWIEPDRSPRVVCELERRVAAMSMTQGVSTVADHIRTGFSQGFRTPESSIRFEDFRRRL